MEDQNSGRRRQHPQERFAAPQHPYDLAAAAKALRQEAQAGEGGHRQAASTVGLTSDLLGDIAGAGHGQGSL